MGDDSDSMAGMQDLARQMFEAWQKAAAGSVAGGNQAQDPTAMYRQGMDWWTSLAKQAGAGNPGAGLGDAVERLSAQAGPWLGMMQQVVGQFGQGDGSAGDIAKAWRSMVEATGANPLNDLLRSFPGGGSQDFGSWLSDAGPMLGMFASRAPDWTRQPAFGFMREHQERGQRLAMAVREYQQHQKAYDQLMLEALRKAFPLFEEKLAERSEPGRQIDSVRGLFDVWIDAAEEAYAEVALSEAFRTAYGQMVNSMMRLRQAMQAELEVTLRAVGMPTRSDVDAGHKRLHALEREVRRLRAQLVAGVRAGSADTATDGGTRRSQSSSAQAPKKKATVRKAAAKKAAVKKATAKSAAKKGPAAKSAKAGSTRKPAATKQAAVRKSAKAKAAPAKAAAKSAGKSTATRKPAGKKTNARRGKEA